MIDTKTRLVLSILAKESKSGGYKVFEIQDIIMSLPRHYRIDKDGVKHILAHLERQDIISIKYEDDDTYCICVLPFGFEILENEKPKYFREKNNKKINKNIFLTGFFAAFLGTLLAFSIFYFLIKFI